MRRARPSLWLGPALALIALVALFPLGWSLWESLHRNDLRLPWLGKPFVGTAHFAAMMGDERFGSALGHTLFFTVSTVALELALGLGFALILNRAFRGRSLLRTATILPWALPTVVAGLMWRFVFDAESGPLAAAIRSAGGDSPVWLADRWLAWVPLLLADVWKTTPFVALLLLAGLQQIPRELYEAAAMDGAGSWRSFRSVTLPMLVPSILIALAFRTLDAFRVFDLVYVLTGGGPGTATEPLALYTFNMLFQNLRFGYGSALAIATFAIAALLGALAVVSMRKLAR